jgi:hypothetical protein
MNLTHARRSECLTIDEMVRPFLDPAEADALNDANLGEGETAEVRAWLDALRPVVEGPRAGRGARLAIAAQTMSVPNKTARNKFDALQREGWRGLVDGRRKEACAKMADIDCSNKEVFVNWIKGMAENYGGNIRHARRAAIAFWKTARKTSEKIPGYSSWPLPGIGGYPIGWSYGNIAKIAKLTNYERTVAGIGRAAARSCAPMVLRTRVGLRVGEAYMVDDVWHDIDCHMLGSQKQFVRPMELAVMDVFSAYKCAYGLKPRIKDEATGKRINLRATDMRFLTAHLFCNIGYNADRCFLFAEHGTAKVQAEIAALLKEYSRDAIRVVEGSIQDKPALLGAWTGKQAGNPRNKSALESSHRIPHFAAKYLPGQTGGNSRDNMPEDHHGRESAFKEVDKMVELVLQRVGKENAAWYLNEFQAPVLNYYAYAKWVDDYYPIVHSFTDHELEGWERAGLMVSGFRSTLNNQFFSYSELSGIDKNEADAIRAMLAASPHLNVCRRMSRGEVWESGRRALRKFPAEAFPRIVGKDLAVEHRVLDHAISFRNAEIERGREFVFPATAIDPRGLEIILKDKEYYSTVLNPFDPSKLFILDSKFRYIGALSEQIVSCHTDMEGMQRAMGQAAHAEALAMLPYRMRHADKEGEVQRMKDHNNAILSGMVKTPEERAVQDRARASAQAGDMAALLSACGQPARDVEADTEAPADLSSIFGPTPGSQE